MFYGQLTFYFFVLESFKGDTYLLVKLLLPGVVKRVYNVNNRSIVKYFASIFGTDHKAMMTHLEEGDVSETVKVGNQTWAGIR